MTRGLCCQSGFAECAVAWVGYGSPTLDGTYWPKTWRSWWTIRWWACINIKIKINIKMFRACIFVHKTLKKNHFVKLHLKFSTSYLKNVIPFCPEKLQVLTMKVDKLSWMHLKWQQSHVLKLQWQVNQNEVIKMTSQ